jgi:hypothetical protein
LEEIIMEIFEESQYKARVDNLIRLAQEHEAKLETLDRMARQIDEIRDALLGTLKDTGWLSIVAGHEKFIQECMERRKRDNKSRFDKAWWIEKAIITAIITVFMWVAEYHLTQKLKEITSVPLSKQQTQVENEQTKGK